jgi:hypothetical protein
VHRMQIRKSLFTVATIAALTLGAGLSSHAQTPPADETPSAASPATTVDREDRDFDWGWLGLIGLLGLGGLAGRNREGMTTRRTTVRNDNI